MRFYNFLLVKSIKIDSIYREDYTVGVALAMQVEKQENFENFEPSKR